MSFLEKRFVTKTADGGHSEVQLAQLAADRATNPDIRSFAQKLVSDHTQVNSELMSLAASKNIILDKDDDQDRVYRRLSRASGMEFDREFVEHMVEAHEDGVKRFEKAAQDTKDPDLRSFASKYVGKLREHLQQAKSLQQAAMPTGRMDSSSGGYNTTPISSSSPSAPSSSSTSTDASPTPSSPSDSAPRGTNPTGGASSTDRGTAPGSGR